MSIHPLRSYEYRFCTFGVLRIFKETGEGLHLMPSLRTATGQKSGDFINVVLTHRAGVSGYLPADFRQGIEYVLFLDVVGPALYGRIPPDDLCREHPWNAEVGSSLGAGMQPLKGH